MAGPARQVNQRSYQGAVSSRLTSDWLVAQTSADTELRGALRTLRG